MDTEDEERPKENEYVHEASESIVALGSNLTSDVDDLVESVSPASQKNCSC